MPSSPASGPATLSVISSSWVVSGRQRSYSTLRAAATNRSQPASAPLRMTACGLKKPTTVARTSPSWRPA